MVVQAAPANPLISPPCLNLFPLSALSLPLPSSSLCCPLLFPPHTRSPLFFSLLALSAFSLLPCQLWNPLLLLPALSLPLFWFFIKSNCCHRFTPFLPLWFPACLSPVLSPSACPLLSLSFSLSAFSWCLSVVLSCFRSPLPLAGCCVVSARALSVGAQVSWVLERNRSWQRDTLRKASSTVPTERHTRSQCRSRRRGAHGTQRALWYMSWCRMSRGIPTGFRSFYRCSGVSWPPQSDN